MERIVIIWISLTGTQRAVFEMPVGNMAEASRIFADLIKQTKQEKEAIEPKNLGPGLPVVERSEGS